MKSNKILSVLLGAIVALSITVGAAEMNFKGMAIKDFIETIGKKTGKNILINVPLKGKIDFVSNKPVSKDALFDMANSILSSKGYAMIDRGEFYEVIKASDVGGSGVPVTGENIGKMIQTRLFKLKTSNAAVIRAKIKPLLHKNAKVISFKNNNVLSVTAYPRTLDAIETIINSVEGAGRKGATTIKLENASSKGVYPNAVKMAAQLFPKTIPSEKVDVLQDEATNSIILVGKKDNVAQMIKFIKQLDQKGENQEQQMYVIPLQNSNVEVMEKILGKLISQMNNMPTAKKRVKGAKAPAKAMVVGDQERNALIVLATGDQIKNIRAVLRKIDVEKPQVYIKVKIVEINTNLARRIGLRYGFEGGAITPRGILSFAGRTGSPVIALGNTILSKMAIDGNVERLFALGVVMDLLQEEGAASVLSEPSVLCTNNQESEIYVGETRSILTSSAQGDNKNDDVRNNYSREDIGITLKVKPRLSSNDKVTLTISAIIEDIVPGTSNNSDRPNTTKRKVNTNAIVRNGDTVIMGGLIKDSAGISKSSVPGLGDMLSDVPIFKNLFSSSTNEKNNVNVVVYVTPYIVKRSSDLVKLKSTLGELDGIEDQYSRIVRKHLRARTNHKRGSSIFSRFTRGSSDEVIDTTPISRPVTPANIVNSISKPTVPARPVNPINNSDLY